MKHIKILYFTLTGVQMADLHYTGYVLCIWLLFGDLCTEQMGYKANKKFILLDTCIYKHTLLSKGDGQNSCKRYSNPRSGHIRVLG